MPSYSRFQPLPPNYLPPPSSVSSAVTEMWDSEDLESPDKYTRDVVFGGLGEPPLRLTTLTESVSLIRSKYPDSKFRVMTNGLHTNADSVAELLSTEGISTVTVSLNYPDHESYSLNMLNAPDYDPPYFPLPSSSFGSPSSNLSFSTVLNFMETLAEADIKVVATAVDNGRVDLGEVERIARDHGAGKFKVRSYHP